jgi:TRAP-type mannitol/chloroaromatic compound transport system permease small subunit
MTTPQDPSRESGDPIRTGVIPGLLRRIDLMGLWGGRIASYMILVATAQVCYELILRYVFNKPTVWGLETTLYLCAVTYVMSGAYASVHNAHIRVDLFYSRWRPKVRAAVDILVTDLLFFFFCGVLVWQSSLWFYEAWADGLTSGTIWDPPIWPMRLVLVVGGTLLFLSGVGQFIRDVLALFGKEVADHSI